ncbi:MAG: ABC-type multidrug/protein/lipid transport system, ATPase component [Treponematales bacterium]
MAASSLKEYRTLLPYLARYRGRYALGLLCLVIVDGAQMLIPQFMARAVDIIASGVFAFRGILTLCAAMTLLMLVISMGRFAWRYFIHGSSRRIEAEMRERLFSHLLSLSYDFYQKNKTGDLMARASNDLNAVRVSIAMGFVALVDGTVMAAAILAIIFIQDAATAALAVIPLPLITILILLFGRAISKRFLRVQETYSRLSDTVQETFAGIRVIKSFVTEWWFVNKFADNNNDYREANMAMVKLFGFFFPFVTFLSGLTVLIVLVAGGAQVITGGMSPGALVALFRYLQMLVWPLMGAGFMVNMIQRGAVALRRINEVMETEPSIKSGSVKGEGGSLPLAPNLREQSSLRFSATPSPRGLRPLKPLRWGDTPQTPSPLRGDPLNAPRPSPVIETRGLSFTYPGGARALDGVTLAVNEGAALGILGRTGSGKSTLVKAFARMIDPPPDTVFVKGVEISGWDLRELRRLFGFTPQDSYLFSDTLRANIRYGLKDDDGGDGALSFERATAIAALDRDLPAFASGWETLIGERGLTLSGGQKQRAAIARSVIGLPEILVLDDSLSAVDAETEKRILTAFFAERKRQAAAGRPLTLIIISHRVSALEHADKVIVLDSGRVIEEGTPEELAALKGFYARTAALQRLGGRGL